MKKILVAILVLVLCVTALVACNNTDNNEGLERAKEYLDALYKAEPKITAADIERVPSLRVGEDTFTVTWTVEIIDGPQTVTVVPGEGKVIIDVEEATEDVVEDTNYKLIATIADKDGNTVQVSYLHTIPKFKVNTGAEYLAAEAGEAILVDGIVTAILPTGNGATAEGFFMNALDGSCGIYVYGAYTKANDSAEVAVGMTVRVAGEKDVYSGTHELKSASYRVLDTTIQTVEPVDYTSILANAADLKAAELTTAQALLVTIKGVTVGEPGDNGYHYFTLGDKKTYVRISSSQCPLTTAQQTEFKQSFEDHFGYTADVTGLITLYSGSFYLTPVTADAFSNFVAPQLTDQQIVDGTKDALSIVDVIKEAGSVTLPEAGTGIYADATITWALAETTLATLQGNVLNVAELPAEEGTITLTATIAKGDATAATKEFTVKIASQRSSFIKAALNAGAALENKATTTDNYIVIGTVSSIDAEYDAGFGNVSFFVKDAEGNEILIYRYNLEDAATIAVGDHVAFAAPIKKYNDTIEAVADFVALDVMSLADAAAAGLAGTGVDGTVVYGYVKSIDTEYSAQHNNITVTISDGTNDLNLYRLSGGETLAVGDYILVTGTPSAYNNKAQMAQGATYVTSPIYVATETPCEHVDTNPEDCICDLCQAELEHVNEEGDDTLCDICNKDLSDGSTDGPELTHAGTEADPYSVTDALAVAGTLAEGETKADKVFITGVIKSIGSTGTYLQNVYIADTTDSTKQILVYKVNYTTGVVDSVSVGDTVTINGYLMNYNGTLEISSSGSDYAYFTACTPHTCDYAPADCDTPQTCTICGGTTGEALGHTDEADSNGLCDRCGTSLQAAAQTVVLTKTIAEIAEANSWVNSEQYSSFDLDENISVSSSSDGNNGKYYTSGNNYRLYQSNSGTMTITAAEGYEIVAVKVTYTAYNTGCLTLTGSTLASGTPVDVNAQSITFGTGNTGDASNGQARVTAIEVTYRPVA